MTLPVAEVAFGGLIVDNLAPAPAADIATVRFSGLGVSNIQPPIEASTAKDVEGIVARAYDASGAFLGTLPPRSTTFRDEDNSEGYGQVQLDVEPSFPALAWLNAGCTIVASIGSRNLFAFDVDTITESSGPQDGLVSATYSGPGVLARLDDEAIWPERGYYTDTSTERAFDYGARSGSGSVDWLNAAKWVGPRGKPRTKSFRYTAKKAHKPKGWPKESYSQWLGKHSPERAKYTSSRSNFFRTTFTTSAGTRDLGFWVAFEGRGEVQFDNELIFEGSGYGKAHFVRVDEVPSGDHTIAVKVTGKRPVFMLACAQVNDDGNPRKFLRRSHSSSWKVWNGSGHPGWNAGEIAAQLVNEAIARGGYANVSRGFTTKVDSRGQAWPATPLELAFGLDGTTGSVWLTELIDAANIDAWAEPTAFPALRLQVARTRGLALASVRLTALRAWTTTSSWSRLRNVALARQRRGWTQVGDTASQLAYRRRSATFTVGAESSKDAARRQAAKMLADVSTPERTIAVDLRHGAGHQPYAHFNCGDTVQAYVRGWKTVRVKSITAAYDESGLYWQIEGEVL